MGFDYDYITPKAEKELHAHMYKKKRESQELLSAYMQQTK